MEGKKLTVLDKIEKDDSIMIKLRSLVPEIGPLFPNKTTRHVYFLAACCVFHPNLTVEDLEQISESNPYGGLIGIGNSYLEALFNISKIFRLHAVLHDAAGCVKREHNEGPGYCYLMKYFPNACFLGHITGILFLFTLKLFSNQLDCIFC